ncbi:hypothetical protein [Macrococcus psychrotolerans]
MKNINVSVDLNSWINRLPPFPILIYSNNKFHYEFDDLMRSIALATRYPHLSGMLLNDNWAHLRYANCFSESETLKLISKFREVDSHQKTILSDDVGMGMSYCFMDATVGVKAWVDTNFFIKYYSYIEPSVVNGQGGYTSPDFLTIDDNDNFYLIECKGTQNTLSSRNTQIDKGIEQKNNINDPKSIISEKIVMSTFVRYENSRIDSELKIVDPEMNLNLKNVSKELLKKFMLRYELFKELNFIYPNIFSEERFFNYNSFKKYLSINPEKITSQEEEIYGIKLKLNDDLLRDIQKNNSFDELINNYTNKFQAARKFTFDSEKQKEIINHTNKNKDKELKSTDIGEKFPNLNELFKLYNIDMNKFFDNINKDIKTDLITNQNHVKGFYGLEINFTRKSPE